MRVLQRFIIQQNCSMPPQNDVALTLPFPPRSNCPVLCSHLCNITARYRLWLKKKTPPSNTHTHHIDISDEEWEGKLVVTQDDFLEALDKLTPSVSPEELERYKDIKESISLWCNCELMACIFHRYFGGSWSLSNLAVLQKCSGRGALMTRVFPFWW